MPYSETETDDPYSEASVTSPNYETVDGSTGQNDPMRALQNITIILKAMMERAENAAEENAVFKEEILRKIDDTQSLLTELNSRGARPTITNNIELKFKTYLDFKAYDNKIDKDKKIKLVIYAK
jgi:hypothetical protein